MTFFYVFNLYYINGDYMKYIKLISFIVIIILFSVLIYFYINITKEKKTNTVFSEDNYIYLLQYGVYSSKENMNENTKDLINYFYYSDKDGYHVLIGITSNENLIDKIKDSYYVTDNIYIRKENINNKEFIDNLKQYDKLVNETYDKNIIVNAEKQILSRYEELVIRNE